MKAMRADALERVLAVLDRVPDDVTVRELIPRIEWEADKETIRLLCHSVAHIHSPKPLRLRHYHSRPGM